MEGDLTHINETLELIAKGENSSFFNEKYKNVTLVLGLAGSGKSTFLQWLFGDNTRLTSVEISANKFEIVDNDSGISNSTMISKTLFPELIIDDETNTAYYAWPDFSDTRATSIDIANSFFIKRLIEHAESIKIILTVDYSSIKKGADRHSFMLLVQNFLQLIKNLDNYEKSIGLVVTKVENEYKLFNKNNTLIPDKNVLRKIVNFLESVKEDLLASAEKNENKEIFPINAEKLIDIFIEDENCNYNKIMLFRRPDKSGPLSGVELLEKVKPHLKKNIIENIFYTQNFSEDFKYSISDKSKVVLHSLINTVNDKTWEELSQVTEGVQNHFNGITTSYNSEINKFVYSYAMNDVSNIQSYHADTVFVFDSFKNLEQAKYETETLDSLSQQIKVLIQSADIKNVTNLSNLSKNVEYLNFFQLLSDKAISQRPWIDIVKQTTQNMNKTLHEIDNTIKTNGIEKLLGDSKKLLKIFEETLENNLRNRIKSVEIRNATTEIEKHRTWISKLTELVENKKYDELLLLMAELKVNSEDYNINIFQLASNHQKIKYLCNLGEVNNVDCKDESHYKSTVSNLKKLTNDLYKWYTFLNSLQEYTSDYNKFQSNKQEHVNELGKFGFIKKSGDTSITNSTFKMFMEKMKSFHSLASNKFENFANLNNYYFDDLNAVLSFTLNSGTITTSSDGKYVITANILTSTELSNKIKNCSLNNCSFDIIVSDTFYVDSDLNLNGAISQLNIISPKWVIIGTREFNLDGLQGNNGEMYGIDGGDGYPGGPAGNFFGLAMDIENGQQLTISANGGAGGNGKNGGPGSDGKNGINADDSFNYVKDKDYKCEDKGTFVTDTYSRYKYSGTKGTSGSDGGNGGAAGLGGKEGIVKFINLRKGSVPVVVNKPGMVGSYGNGGSPGIGGKNGNNLLTYWYKSAFWGMNYGELKFKKSEVEWVKSRAENGRQGTSGWYKQNPKTPRVNKQFENPANFLAYYIDHFLINTRFLKTNLEFMDLIGSNPTILSSYDTNAIFKEFNVIQYESKITKKDNTLYLYKNLKKIIKNTSRGTYLYTPILFRINLLKPRHQNILALSSEEYVQSIKRDNVQIYLKNKMYNPKLLTQYMEKYKRFVKDRIDDVQLLINQLKFELDSHAKETLQNLKKSYRSHNIDKENMHYPLSDPLITLQIMDSLCIAANSVMFANKIASHMTQRTNLTNLREQDFFQNDSYKLLMQDTMKDLDFIKIKDPENINSNDIITKKALPMVNNIKRNLETLKETKLNHSFSEEVIDWKIPRTLLEINFELQKMKNIYKIDDSISSLFDKFAEAVLTVGNIFTVLPNIYDFEDIGYSLNNWENLSINPTNLEWPINEINDNIKSSIMTEQINQGKNLISFSAFPFGHLYLKNLTENNLQSETNKIEILRNVTDQDYSTLTKTYLKHETFGGEGTAKPFYIWKNEKYSDEIAKLLKGQKIYFYADIFSSDLSKESINLSDIEISFCSKDNATQASVNELLKNFDVKATHFGSSYYIVKKTLYILEREKVEIEFSFEKNENGTRLRDNGILKEIQNGRIVLSPYTTWQFQLTPVNSSFNFDAFRQHENNLDLELSGFGSYIDEKTELPYLNLKAYYSSADQRSFVNLIKHNKLASRGDGLNRARRSNIFGNTPAVSSAGKSTFFLTDIKNYLADKIGLYLNWNKSAYSNSKNGFAIDSGINYYHDEIPKTNVVSGVYDVNETILLAQLVSYALVKDKKIIKNGEFSSPSVLQKMESNSLAHHVLPLIDDAYIRFN